MGCVTVLLYISPLHWCPPDECIRRHRWPYADYRHRLVVATHRLVSMCSTPVVHDQDAQWVAPEVLGGIWGEGEQFLLRRVMIEVCSRYHTRS